ncbi:MAG: hypothetical protein GX455_09560 [Phycisphaerae bacterium]|nr:hypothetical protein [Phycisphaerae bacterium]
MNKHLKPTVRISFSRHPIRIIVAIAVAAAMVFQAYVWVIQREGNLPVPKGFGNFPENRSVLESAPAKEGFSFAVMGDISSVGTFERICDHLRKMPLDFAVLVGDGSYGPAEPEHRYLRAELHEYALSCPFFYVVGNRDVSADRFPLDRFERDYGPSIFSFEYQQCLFIVLRTLEEPFTNEESLAYLRQFRDIPRDRYRYRFVFMHIPPPMTPLFRQRAVPEGDELIRTFEEIGVDYVFSGHYHRYARVRRGSTNYIVSGGGGSNLAPSPPGQFHHALILQVRPDCIEEQIISVSKCINMEDLLERTAITQTWPFMERHPVGLILLDVVGLVLIILLVRRRPIHSR